MHFLRFLLVTLGLSFSPQRALACSSSEDCSLNGLCDGGSSICACDPGWKGDDCGQLDLSPATKGNGYNYGNATSSSYAGKNGNSSWGGQILQDKEDCRKFHLVTSQFGNGCGLSDWKPFSFIIRAESYTGPQGPYHYAETLYPSFRHNPYWFWSPADDKYLLYTIGHEISVPDTCTAQTIANNISVASAPSPSGPWSDFKQILASATNPAPWPLWTEENRTSAIALAVEDNLIYEAGTYDASYTRIKVQSWDSSQTSEYWTEDPFLWRDKRGYWHILCHWMIDILEDSQKYPRVGAHLFSRTLAGNWTFKLQEAFNTTVEYTDGTTIDLYRRERPKVFFSDDGNMTPLYLLNGVQEFNSGGKSYTLIQPIGDAWRSYEKGIQL